MLIVDDEKMGKKLRRLRRENADLVRDLAALRLAMLSLGHDPDGPVVRRAANLSPGFNKCKEE